MTAAQAVARAAKEHGVFLHAETAEHIARAVFEAHDTTYEVRQVVSRETWQRPDYRGRIQRDLRRSLLRELADSDLLPVALPAETLRYLTDVRPGSSEKTGVMEAPAELAESGAVEWGAVVVALKVPVRKTSADAGEGGLTGDLAAPP